MPGKTLRYLIAYLKAARSDAGSNNDRVWLMTELSEARNRRSHHPTVSPPPSRVSYCCSLCGKDADRQAIGD